jgi:hypothetical protein
MPIHLRPRNPRCRAAAAESIGPAARAIVKATAASTEALQAVMNRSDRYPADPATAFAALLEFRRAQAAVDAAIAEYCAWLIVGGVARTAMATGLSIRGATLARMLGPVEHLASAGASDLIRSEGGTWTVHRGDPVEQVEQTL